MHLPPELEWLLLPAPNPNRSVPQHSCICLLCVQHISLTSPFPPLMQHHLSGVLWMIQHSVGDLAVPKSTKPNTAAVMQAFTWVAPMTTVSVRVSCSYVVLKWNSLLCCFSTWSKVSYIAVPSSRCPAQWHLSKCYRGFTAQQIHEYLKHLLLC